MVGTRDPSPAGRRAAAQLAESFSAEGLTVVSGIARGIDAVSHHAALASSGSTIAVLPNGFEHLYPLENRDLYQLARSSEQILLLSEYEPQQKPLKHHFVRRNRIIAGLSDTTVFVEGSEKSGAMITANSALAEGRDVAALSHATLLRNAGGIKLIGDGAIDLTARAMSFHTVQVLS
jgi:DNA processing protein